MSDQSKGEGTKPNLKISSLPKLNKPTNNKIKLQCTLLPPSKNVIACTKQERTVGDDSQETVICSSRSSCTLHVELGD